MEMKKEGWILLGIAIFILIIVIAFYAVTKKDVNQNNGKIIEVIIDMEIKSNFTNGGNIQKDYTCQGMNINPELIFSGIPNNTKSLTIIVDDPDAPSGTFTHWLLFNIPIQNKIEKDSAPGIQGKNDFGSVNWKGPCPPSGEHRYYFKVFALSSTLELQEGATRKQIEEAMKGKILAKGELMGKYAKS
jgi:Raf kinase inhibitor-like YbhB/YbcL family protein